jgi:hypothetical protein
MLRENFSLKVNGDNMKKFKVNLKETVYYPSHEITADSPEEAEDKCRRMREDGLLEGEDCDLSFETEEVKDDG